MLVFIVNIYSVYCRLYGSTSAGLGYLIEIGVKVAALTTAYMYRKYNLLA